VVCGLAGENQAAEKKDVPQSLQLQVSYSVSAPDGQLYNYTLLAQKVPSLAPVVGLNKYQTAEYDTQIFFAISATNTS
jgi:hypothetical protein